MDKTYCIDGAVHYTGQGPSIKTNPNFYPSFQTDLNNFKELLIKKESKKEGASFVHFGDGDYFFFKKNRNRQCDSGPTRIVNTI